MAKDARGHGSEKRGGVGASNQSAIAHFMRALAGAHRTIPGHPGEVPTGQGQPVTVRHSNMPSVGVGTSGNTRVGLIGGKRQAYSATGASTGGGSGGGGSGGSGGGGSGSGGGGGGGGMMSAANKRRGQPAQWKTPQDKLNEMTAPIRQAFQNFKFGKGGVNLT